MMMMKKDITDISYYSRSTKGNIILVPFVIC